VYQYGWNLCEARLIKARALLDYQHKVAYERHKYKEYWKIELGLVAMAIGMALFIFASVAIGMYLTSAPVPPSAQPAALSIESTIQQVKQNIRDINADGKTNCIDYALVFYALYPHSKIIHTWDGKDFNHMLNKVGDQYVEPQAADGNPYKMWPAFKTARKRDVTGKWQSWAFNIRTWYDHLEY
jgi:hypothetical protein